MTFLNIIGTVRNILQGESGGLGRKWSIFVEQNCMGKLVEENWGIEQKWSRLVQKYSWGDNNAWMKKCWDWVGRK